jgi:hypothetical protein
MTAIADFRYRALHTEQSHLEGQVTTATKDNLAGSLAELADLWIVSEYGCFNAKTHEYEPYFANAWPSRLRLNFVEAALIMVGRCCLPATRI